jgi:hypothetical protein
MAKKIKFGKISIVVFLTALIWVWADLAQDERLELSGVVIEVARSSDPALWVSFVVDGAKPNLQTSITLDTVVLKGPASRVAEVSRRKNKGALNLDLFLAPEQEKSTQEGDSTRDVLELLKASDEIGKLGLTVESCEPRTLTIRVRKLVKANVPVECVGLDPSLKVDTLDPSQVEAFVPQDETLKATIQLTPAEQDQARGTPIEKSPYIELVAGQRREVSTKVKVRLVAENVLHDYSVPATLGFCFSPNLQGKYEVVLDNDPAQLATVLIKATPFAQQAYAQAPYQMTLYIHDTDRQQESVTREFVFLFPEEYVRRDEIKANQPAQTAKFRLVPIAEPRTEAPGM